MNTGTSKPPCLVAGYRVSENMATFLALASNALLAWLVITRSQKELHAFKRVLLLGCGVDMLFAVTFNLFEFHLDIRHGVFTAINNSPFVFKEAWMNHMVCSICLFPIHFTISFVSVPIVFRYFVVCRSHVLNKLELFLLLTITAIPAIVFNACEAALWYALSEKTIADYEYELAADECYDRGQVPLLHYKEMLKPSVFAPTAVSGGIVIGSYGVILFCVAAMRQTLRTSRAFSEKTRRLQKQLEYTLIVQSLIPLFLFVIPIIGCILAILGVEQLRPVALLCTSLVSWIAVCNPISAMIFIKAYRRALVEYCMKVVPLRLHSRVYATSTSTERES
ncbi:7TM GPCR protein [Aphelenchoides avenae]|nr:7TM GPCR protein [Aphelenchus avenae]